MKKLSLKTFDLFSWRFLIHTQNSPHKTPLLDCVPTKTDCIGDQKMFQVPELFFIWQRELNTRNRAIMRDRKKLLATKLETWSHVSPLTPVWSYRSYSLPCKSSSIRHGAKEVTVFTAGCLSCFDPIFSYCAQSNPF